MDALLALTGATVPLGIRFGVAAVAGLMVGSFLNVVVYRVPRGLSITAPRSFCPLCRRQLTWWENIPVLSWLVLGARCRTCRAPIAIRYPLVEVATGAMFVLITAMLEGSILAIPYCGLGATIAAILVVDAGSLRSPLGLAAAGTLTANLALVGVTAWQHAWGVLVGAQVGLAIGILAYSVLRRRDPECHDDRWVGRSALIPLGCWLGGLGGPASAWGLLVGFAYLVTSIVIVMRRTPNRSAPESATAATRGPLRVLQRPLLASAGIAAATSLLVAH